MSAYKAVVMDFLLEALREIEAAKCEGSSGAPPWGVQIQNISSIAFGSFCTFLTATSVCLQH